MKGTRAFRSFARAVKGGHAGGFTLLEVIIALVLVAILGTFLVMFMSGVVTRSVEPVLQTQCGCYLHGIMENVTVDYNTLMLTDETPIATLSDRINDGDYADEDHSYTVVTNDRISFVEQAGEMVEQSDSDGDVLKVTLEYQGQRLTSLFAE
ncbi:MAG TPA: type II secretion system protein [Deltaproteobacteria bacterium]|nr:type II secretion system protein [Deltaproteobacteria bacterium]